MGWIDALKATINGVGHNAPGIQAGMKAMSGVGGVAGGFGSNIIDGAMDFFMPKRPQQSDTSQVSQSRPTFDFATRGEADPTFDPGPGANEQAQKEDIYTSLLNDLKSKIARTYSYDGAGDKQVDSAFQGALDALGNARTRTNDNFNTSRANIDTLTNSHVANIKGADRQAVTQIGSDLQSSYGSNYDNRAKELAADRDKELATKTEMLQRLGIQDAGLGGAGDVQTQAITDNSAEKAGAMQQAQGYQAADLVRNTEQASSMANAGVERQSDLRRQLDGILGQLDNSEAGIRNDMSQAKLSAQQADRANFQKEQGYYNDTLGTLLKDQSDRAISDRDFQYKAALDAAKGGGSNGMFDVIGNQIQKSTGKDPAPYIAAYQQAIRQGGGVLAGKLGDKNSYLVGEISKILPPELAGDNDMISRVVFGVSQYGTDKMTAK